MSDKLLKKIILTFIALSFGAVIISKLRRKNASVQILPTITSSTVPAASAINTEQKTPVSGGAPLSATTLREQMLKGAVSPSVNKAGTSSQHLQKLMGFMGFGASLHPDLSKGVITVRGPVSSCNIETGWVQYMEFCMPQAQNSQIVRDVMMQTLKSNQDVQALGNIPKCFYANYLNCLALVVSYGKPGTCGQRKTPPASLPDACQSIAQGYSSDVSKFQAK